MFLNEKTIKQAGSTKRDTPPIWHKVSSYRPNWKILDDLGLFHEIRIYQKANCDMNNCRVMTRENLLIFRQKIVYLRKIYGLPKESKGIPYSFIILVKISIKNSISLDFSVASPTRLNVSTSNIEASSNSF